MGRERGGEREGKGKEKEREREGKGRKKKKEKEKGKSEITKSNPVTLMGLDPYPSPSASRRNSYVLKL